MEYVSRVWAWPTNLGAVEYLASISNTNVINVLIEAKKENNKASYKLIKPAIS